MNVGLFALLAGFLLPLTLVVRVGAMLAMERYRGFAHPLNLVLAIELLLGAVPVIALAPSAWTAVSGQTIDDGLSLVDFTASDWGLVKLAVNVAAVLLADAAMPRVYDQLVQEPSSVQCPTRFYVVRDLAVLAICLGLACAAAVGR